MWNYRKGAENNLQCSSPSSFIRSFNEKKNRETERKDFAIVKTNKTTEKRLDFVLFSLKHTEKERKKRKNPFLQNVGKRRLYMIGNAAGISEAFCYN